MSFNIGHFCALKSATLLPAAALWYWGILVSGRLKLGSSRRMSRLSFRLLLFVVFADLHFVFLFGILVGNFIFNFLLFSYTEKQNRKCPFSDTAVITTDSEQHGALVGRTLAVELALVNNLELLLGWTFGGPDILGLSTWGEPLWDRQAVRRTKCRSKSLSNFSQLKTRGRKELCDAVLAMVTWCEGLWSVIGWKGQGERLCCYHSDWRRIWTDWSWRQPDERESRKTVGRQRG